MQSRENVQNLPLHENRNPRKPQISPEDYDQFLEEKSKVVAQKIRENRDIFLRLKDK